MILMADLSYKPIEEVQVGEYIMSYEEATDTYEPQQVLVCQIYENKKTLHIYLDDGSILKATAQHPILTTNGWVSRDYVNALKEALIETKYMNVGQTIMGYYKNKNIINIEEDTELHTVYNFKVAVNHTFIADDCIVHNMQVKGS